MYFSVLKNNLANILSYEVYMCNKANSASTQAYKGLHICAIGYPESLLLNTILPNDLFLLRNDFNNFNYLSIVSTEPADVRVIIEDLLN